MAILVLSAYMKEDCDTDPGWCFKAAVGKSLPDTFFTYDKASEKAANNIAKDTNNLIMPTESAHTLQLFQQVGPSMLNQRSEMGSTSERYGQVKVPHRFSAIHAQRDSQNAQNNHAPGSKDNSTSRGYADGLKTARIFGAYNMSRLGFAGQFMADAIRVAGPVLVAQGTEGDYNAGFMTGLRYGEADVFGTRKS